MRTPRAYSVETRDLNLWYGDFQALINVSVQIAQGRITSLIGPSGCGKTTLLRCFNRVNERYGNVKTTGEIKILAKNIYDPDVSLIELRKSVGMVFQRPNPLPISIYENIVFGQRIHQERRAIKKSDLDQIVEQSLREVFLWDDLKDKLHERAISLQLEQQQKLCIGRQSHARDRGTDDQPHRPLHHDHRHPQHGPGTAHQRGMHFHAPGRTDGT